MVIPIGLLYSSYLVLQFPEIQVEAAATARYNARPQRAFPSPLVSLAARRRRRHRHRRRRTTCRRPGGRGIDSGNGVDDSPRPPPEDESVPAVQAYGLDSRSLLPRDPVLKRCRLPLSVVKCCGVTWEMWTGRRRDRRAGGLTKRGGGGQTETERRRQAGLGHEESATMQTKTAAAALVQ